MEKKLTPSQLELVRLKQNLFNQTLQQIQSDWQATLQLIAQELGIEDLSYWQFVGDKFVQKPLMESKTEMSATGVAKEYEKEANDGQRELDFEPKKN